MSLDGVM